MKVLVTGGCGFIGKHLVKRLHAEGHTPIIYDMAPFTDDLPRNCYYRQGNISDPYGLLEAMKGVDYVFHLGAMASTIKSANAPVTAFEINALGTLNVLKASLDSNVKQVYIASSSLVSNKLLYDTYHEHCSDELIDLSSKGHVYSTSKLVSEMLALDFSDMYGLPSTIMRIGICYGPNMTQGVLVDNFIRNALVGKPMIIEGDGTQWRQYIYIYDLIEGCIRVLEEGYSEAIYNLVPEWTTSVNKVAKAVQKVLPGSTIEYRKPRLHDFAVQKLDPSNNLGWKAKVGIEEGISYTIDWYERGA